MSLMQQSLPFAARAERPPSRRNLVIEAGAGTGKTTAIVAEVLGLMLDREELDAERIVLMTFTEKAAGEIADRIRGALEELHAALSGSPDGMTGNNSPGLLATPDETKSRRPSPRVSGERVAEGRVRGSAEAESRITWPADSPNPLVVIEPSRRDAALRAIERHLANVDAVRSQTIHSFCQSILRTFPIEAGLDPQFKIIQGFERALLYDEAYDAWVDEETRVRPDESTVAEWELLFTHTGYLFQIRRLILTLVDRRDLLAETEYGFGSFEEDVERPLTEAVLWIRRETAEVKDPAAQRVAQYVRETPFSGGSADEWLAWLQPIAGSIREVKLPSCGKLKEPMSVLRSGGTGDSVYDRLLAHRAAMALVALTRRFLTYLDAEKYRRGVVDFDDLLLRTVAVLDNPAVLSRARAQFDHIFVDEFQDTDRVQARIIDRLGRDENGLLVPGRTIIVGDPKQSIYGFRRADPETYYRMSEELTRAGAERRPIVDQYRSDPPLVDALNAIFTRLFPSEAQHDPNVFRPPYQPLHAARTHSRRELDARITLIGVEHEEKGDRYLVEAASIAEWIRAQNEPDLRRFAILFRRMTYADDYLDTLERYGIRYVLPPSRMFLDRRAPVDMLAVLRAIAFPFDRGAQVSAARTPYFALTDDEIVRAGTGATEPAWDAFAAAIERYREASHATTVSDLIDLVVRTTNIEGVYRASEGGERHLRHLEHLRSIAFEYDQRRGGSVRQFVDEIADRRAEPEEMEPSAIDENDNAVRVLSVHAAKGLEFDTVIIPDLAFPTTSADGPQLFAVEEPRRLVLTGGAESISAQFTLTADGEKLKSVATERERAELRRLFYVAATRAKTEVVFVCNTSDDTKNTGFLQCLTAALGVEKAALAESFPESGREVRSMAIGSANVAVAFEKVEVRGAAARRRQRLRDAALEEKASLAPLASCEIREPEVDGERLTPGEIAVRRAASRNRAAGILLHRVMELWDGAEPVDALLRRAAGESGADAATAARVGRRLAAIARSPMMQRVMRAETVGRELPLRIVEGDAIVERRVDRVIREGERDVVIDYKSGVATPRRVAADREQVARYCSALSAITGRLTSGVLWYVDVESDEVVEV